MENTKNLNSTSFPKIHITFWKNVIKDTNIFKMEFLIKTVKEEKQVIYLKKNDFFEDTKIYNFLKANMLILSFF